MVSIIIPTYNVSEYIDKCLYSIEAQSYNDIEIIIIDDGSSDDTLYKVKQFAKSSSRNYKIISQKNYGQSVARNRGIKEAIGEYIIFVDSDDWLSSDDAIKKMVDIIASENADYAQCSFEFVKHRKSSSYIVPNKESISGIQPLLDTLKVKDLYTSPWGKIYSTDFIRKNSLYFMEGVVNEDTGFSISIAAKASKVAFLNDIVYSSREREGSTSRASFIRMFMTMHRVLSSTREFLKNNNKYNTNIKNLFESRYLRSMLYNLMQTAQRSNYRTYIEDRNYCFLNTDYLLKLHYKTFLPLKHKLLATLSCNEVLFFCTAKCLKILGFRMH